MSASGTVGKATVERMIMQTKSDNRKIMFLGAGALVVMLILVAGFLIYNQISSNAKISTETQNALSAAAAGAPMSVGAIVEKYGNSVVTIDESWKLINTQSGRQVYHYYIPNVWEDAKGEKHYILADRRAAVAVYAVLSDGTYEPWLSDGGGNHPIGGSGSGTGFCVTSDGFILTARHVGAGWMTRYEYPPEASPGVIGYYGSDNKFKIRSDPTTGQPALYNKAANWVPSQTRQFGSNGISYPVGGRHEFINVTFPKNQTSIPAQVARISDRHDVALLKINIPDAVPKLELHDNYDTIKAGDTAIVLGYPSVSPVVYGVVKSQDIFNRETQNKIVPDPSVTVGNIGRVLRGEPGSGSNRDNVESLMGDVYQVTANPGAGNSGGPVFDDRGGVVGIYFAGRQSGAAQVSFAVPIRYAKELMTTSPSR